MLEEPKRILSQRGKMKITNGKSAGKVIALSYLTGVYLGDGSAYKTTNNRWIFSLTSIDEDFVKVTQDCFDFVFGKRGVFTLQDYNQRQNKNWSKTYQYYNLSKRIVKWFTRVTKRKMHIPRYISYSYASKLAFLAGIWDSEGYFAEYNKYKDRKGNLRTEWTRWMCGIGATESWIHSAIEIMKGMGIYPNKMQVEKPRYENYNTMYRYTFNVKNFISKGCFFCINRKMNRVNRCAEHNNLDKPINIVREILRDFTLNSK